MAGQMKNVELEDEFGDPPPYESTTTTEGVEQQKGFNREYLFSAPGALRVVEMVGFLGSFLLDILVDPVLIHSVSMESNRRLKPGFRGLLVIQIVNRNERLIDFEDC